MKGIHLINILYSYILKGHINVLLSIFFRQITNALYESYTSPNFNQIFNTLRLLFRHMNNSIGKVDAEVLNSHPVKNIVFFFAQAVDNQ